ncbi:MAG: histidine phosphatase family protein [Alphaproteobacteria bacterium]
MHFRFDLGAFSIRVGHPPPLTVYLTRHMQSVTNVDREMHLKLADPEVPGTPLGHKQAAAGAVALADDMEKRGLLSKRFRIYRSDYLRAVETSCHVSGELHSRMMKRGISTKLYDIRTDDRIRELEFGVLNGLGQREIATLFPDYDAYQQLLRAHHGRYYIRRFGGESPADVGDRVRSFVGAMYRDQEKHGINTFVVVNHGLTSRVLAKILLKQDRYWYEEQQNPQNCAIRLIVGKTDHGYIHGGVEDWD